MEQHPVPQNIIDVEFKLFGSFTLKQFSKILFGCLVAVGIFFLPFIPVLVKFILIFLSIAIGVLMAIIPHFGVWLSGFVKAILISPRYVWVKESETPSLLKDKKQEEVKNNQKVTSLKSNEKIDISQVPLDKLFAAKGAKNKNESYVDNTEQMSDSRRQNLDRLYQQMYGQPAPQRPVIQQAQVQPQPQRQIPPEEKLKMIDQEIGRLKYELSMLNRDETFAQKEQQILSRINDLYHEVKAIRSMQAGPQNVPVQSNVRGNTVRVQPVNSNVRTVFGIVVDKKDNPVSRVIINFINLTDNRVYSALSSPDGRFATQSIPVGQYEVVLEHQNYKFHKYQIDVKDQKLPAYKFREK